MKKTNYLYILAFIFLITIIYSLSIDLKESFYNSNYEVSIGTNKFFGPFLKTCNNCSFNGSMLSCTCSYNNPVSKTKVTRRSNLLFSNEDLTKLPSIRINMDTNGNLSKQFI
jgi:hypothetical protein